MKAFLMHRDRDFDFSHPAPAAAELVRDLELGTLFTAMASGDAFLREVGQTALLSSLTDVHEIQYRQAIVRDCLANPSVVRGIYALAVEAIEEEKKHYWGLLSRQPSSILHRSVSLLQILVGVLRRLRAAAEIEEVKFGSEGFRSFFAMLRRELDEPYLRRVEGHIERLKFRHGPLISWQLRIDIAGSGAVLRRPQRDERPWVRRLLTDRRPSYTFHIHERDEVGGRIVSELRDRGIGIVANATAQSSDHIVSFFRMLRTELAFYIGALNLYECLTSKGLPICLPEPVSLSERKHAARGLYDPCFALVTGSSVVSNDLAADAKDLVIVTGANQGGKTTWLRSIGVAQLMMQCGLFVPAAFYRANLCGGLFVHFRREEDITMRVGKFEEELQRISGIVDGLARDGMVLFNESLQSTNEREGSAIGRQIIEGLIHSGVKVIFVTHMYDLAGGLFDLHLPNAHYLRAERRADGRRTFRIIPGAPLPTSYGREVYEEIFGGLSWRSEHPPGCTPKTQDRVRFGANRGSRSPEP